MLQITFHVKCSMLKLHYLFFIPLAQQENQKEFFIQLVDIWLYAAMTHKYTFDYQEGDIYWCTADIGWIVGHSYIVYGPLSNGGTTLMFEGIPTYPDACSILADN